MIDKSGQVSALGGINDVLQINSEEIGTSNTRRLVLMLSQIGHTVPDHLTYILNDLQNPLNLSVKVPLREKFANFVPFHRQQWVPWRTAPNREWPIWQT